MSLYKKFFQVSALAFLSYPIAFLAQVLTSSKFGTSYAMDAYWLGMTFVLSCTFFAHPFREVMVPEYTQRYMVDKIKGTLYLSRILNFSLICIGIMSIGIAFFSHECAIFVSQSTEEQKIYEIQRILRPLSLYALLFCITELLNSILVSKNKVLFQGIGKIIGSTSTIIFILLFSKQYKIHALVFGCIFAQSVLLAIQIYEMWRTKIQYTIFALPKPDKHFIIMTSALIITYFLGSMSVLFARSIFYSLDEGVLSGFQFAQTLYFIPENIFVTSLCTVLWPRLMEQVGYNKTAQALELVALSCQKLALFFVFITAFTFVYASEIVWLIYFRGAFNEQSLTITASILQILIFGLIPQGVALIIGRLLISLQRFTLVGSIGVANSLILIFVLFLAKVLDTQEYAVFYPVLIAYLSVFLSLFAVIRIYKMHFFALFTWRKISWWLRLCICGGLLVFLYPKFEVMHLAKEIAVLHLFGHCVLMAMCYLICCILLNIIPWTIISQTILKKSITK